MKYFLRVLFVLLLAIAVVFGVYCYTDTKNSDVQGGNANLTTVTKPPVTEKGRDRVLLKELEQDGEKFSIYQCDKDTIVIHNGKEYVFHDWSKYIAVEDLEMHYMNYDTNDKESELAIRIPSTTNLETGEYLYDIYVLDFFTNDDGEEDVDLRVASEISWRTILNNAIKMELSQPSFCPKFVQVAMAYRWDKNIGYDEEGMADSVYHAYAHALKDGKGGYLETDRWSFGQGMYTFTDEGEIRVDIDVRVLYKGSSVEQDIGAIHFELIINNANEFACQQKTMGFKANAEYRSLRPNKKSDEKWQYVEQNEDKTVSEAGDKVIDWISYTFEYDPEISENTVSYAEDETEMRNIYKTVFTNEYIKLYAKKGYSFGTTPVETGDYEVVINNDVKKKRYEISYKADITEENGREVLTIYFERSYPENYFETVTINYNTES